jgi:hypothetical protein
MLHDVSAVLDIVHCLWYVCDTQRIWSQNECHFSKRFCIRFILKQSSYKVNIKRVTGSIPTAIMFQYNDSNHERTGAAMSRRLIFNILQTISELCILMCLETIKLITIKFTLVIWDAILVMNNAFTETTICFDLTVVH